MIPFEETEFDPTKKDVRKLNELDLLNELGRRGYVSVKRDLPPTDQLVELPELHEPIELGVLGDTHLGSEYQQLSYLKHFYDYCYKRGIRLMLHCGDVLEGTGKVYKGQTYEMFKHGSTALAKYVVNVYPKYENMITYLIGGNHEYSFFKSEGQDILKDISRERPDFNYLGMFGAFIMFGNIKFYMMHGSGGGAYARSYKMQKIIEQFAPEVKPHILLMGHFHTPCHLPMYRNVEGIQLPCFQSQTPYLRRKGLFPNIGGVILKIYPDFKGMGFMNVNWRYYYEPVEHDY